MGIPYSLADIDDVSESVTTRDDISTTTSGSYTINPEDLVNEIDELFFNDVIVWCVETCIFVNSQKVPKPCLLAEYCLQKLLSKLISGYMKLYKVKDIVLYILAFNQKTWNTDSAIEKNAC